MSLICQGESLELGIAFSLVIGAIGLLAYLAQGAHSSSTAISWILVVVFLAILLCLGFIKRLQVSYYLVIFPFFSWHLFWGIIQLTNARVCISCFAMSAASIILALILNKVRQNI